MENVEPLFFGVSSTDFDLNHYLSTPYTIELFSCLVHWYNSTIFYKETLKISLFYFNNI